MEPEPTRMLQSRGSPITLGIPVNAQELIVKLEAYLRKKEMDVIWNLHLRNRTGRNDFFAKFSTEIIFMIENELLQARTLSYDGFEGDFACFEDRCEPQIEFDDEKEMSDITFGRRRPSGLVHGWRRYSDQICIARLLAWQDRNAAPFGAHNSQSFFYAGCHICHTVLWQDLTHEGLVAQALRIHRQHLHQPLRLKMKCWLEDVFRNDVGKILLEDFGLTVKMTHFELATNVSARALTGYTRANYHAPPEHITICYLTRPWGTLMMSDGELTKKITKAMETLGLEPFYSPPPSIVKARTDVWAD